MPRTEVSSHGGWIPGPSARVGLMMLGPVAGSLGIVLYFGLHVDNAWQFIAAQRLLDTGAFCCDLLMETNPPLATYLTTIAVMIERGTPLGPSLAHWLWTLILASVSLAASARVLVRARIAPASRGFLLLASWGLLLLLPGHEIGQREHWLLLLAWPYLLAVGLRTDRQRLRDPGALAVGMLAGLGLALKPQMLLVVPLLELVDARRRCCLRCLVNPYLAGIGLAVGLYGLFILGLHQRYLAEVPSIYAVYGYLRPQPRMLPLLLGLAIAAVLLGARGWQKATRAGVSCCSRLVAMLLLAGGLFALVAFVQGKGWPYYYLPSYTVLALVLAIRLGRRDMRLPARLAAALLICAMSVPFLRTHPLARTQLGIADYLARSGQGAAVVLDAEIAFANPAILISGLNNASRFPSLWWHHAALSPDADGLSPSVQVAIRRWDAAVAADLDRHRPAIVVVRARGPHLGYLMRQPAFRRAFQPYCRSEPVASGFVAYLRCSNRSLVAEDALR